MKIIVFGANGMAGHMAALYLMEQGHDITGFVKKKNDRFPCVEGNAFDAGQIKKLLHTTKYDIAVNCIGILNKSVDADLSKGIYINSVFPHLLEEYLEDTKLIHISTDCVFSGKKGRYKENSFADADSYYGRTKVLGELRDEKNLTFRTSIVGPELKEDGTGLFHWFMTQSAAVEGFSGAIWSGVTTLELAKAIDCAIQQDLKGLYHLVNNTVISKYELLCLFNQYMKNGRMIINKNTAFNNDKSLVDTRMELKHKIPSYERMICELSEWMSGHQDLYRQYY